MSRFPARRAILSDGSSIATEQLLRPAAIVGLLAIAWNPSGTAERVPGQLEGLVTT